VSLVRDTLVRHLEQNCLIQDSQHRFRKGRSCLTNLLTFLDKVTGSINSGSSVDVVFLDFAKAFDKVPHKRLAQKLEAHGIDGLLLKWITEWLHGKQQRVCIRGTFSWWSLAPAWSLESKLSCEQDILNSYCLYASLRETAAHRYQVVIRTHILVCSYKKNMFDGWKCWRLGFP